MLLAVCLLFDVCRFLKVMSLYLFGLLIIFLFKDKLTYMCHVTNNYVVKSYLNNRHIYTMGADVQHMIPNIHPIRCNVLAHLRPSDIMSLCIALRFTLTKEETKYLMNPLKEIFSSLEWVNEVLDTGGTVALYGDYIDKICDPRCTQVKVWLYIYRPLLNRFNHPVDMKEKINDECKIQDMRSDVESRPITINNYYPYVRGKRLIILTCVIDDIRIFRLSFDFIFEIIERKEVINKLDNLVNDLPYEFTLPFIVFKKEDIYRGETDIFIPYFINSTLCNTCMRQQYLSTHLSIVDWRQNQVVDNNVISSYGDTRWYIWIENLNCERHKLHSGGISDIMYPEH